MSSFLGDRPADTLSALRAALGASGVPNLKQLEGSDGIVFAPDGSAVILPAVSVRRHVFHDPQSLAGWLLDWTDKDRVEVLVDETRVVAVVDAESAQHDDVECSLRFHPVFDRWRMVFGRRLDQKALHSLLRRTVADFYGREVAMPGGATGRVGAGDKLLAGISKLQVRKDRSFRADLGTKGEMLLKASDEKNEASFELPDMFEIEVPIFVDVALLDSEHGTIEPKYIIRVLVDLDLDDLTPRFTLTAPDIALQLLDARRDVARCLREQLGEGWTVGLGAARTQVILTAPKPPVRPIFAFASVVDIDHTATDPEIAEPSGAAE